MRCARPASARHERFDRRHRRAGVAPPGAPLIDPRLGDFESDHSAPKQRSLLAIAGSLLGEISLPKLAVIWTVQILAPAVLLGLAPLILTASVGEASSRFDEATGIGAALIVIAAAAVAISGWRPLFRLAEANFWSLNALAVQPGYAFWREAIRHLAERSSAAGRDPARADARGELRGGGRHSVRRRGAGRLRRLADDAMDRDDLRSLGAASARRPDLANTIVVMSAYLAVASLVWGLADATADQPLDLPPPGAPPPGARVFRVAHLSDVHVVGERYGMRIESGRAGARSNARLRAGAGAALRHPRRASRSTSCSSPAT